MNRALIEAILFSSSKPLSIPEIARISGISKDEVKKIVEEMIDEYEDEKHGIQLRASSRGYKFFTKPQYSKYAEKVAERRTRDLTIQQIEVLAYIAYRGPITRKELMELRGKSADGILRELLNMGLISRRRSSKKGKPYEYRITRRFAEMFEPFKLEEIFREVEEVHPAFRGGVEEEGGPSDKTEEGEGQRDNGR